MKKFQIAELQTLADCPSDNELEWLRAAESSVSFLRENATNDEVVIYANGKSALIHGVLAPTRNLLPPDAHDLQHGSFPMGDDCWAIQRVWSSGDGHRMYLEPPLSSGTSKSFEGGEKLIYRRSFSGVDRGPSPIEVSQKLVHSLAIYFVSERNAFCRLDARGELVDVIKILRRGEVDAPNRLEVVTILRKDLDEFMALSGTALVLRFDFTRVRWASFAGWGQIEHFERDEPDLYFHGGTNGQGSFVNGAMVVRTQVTVDQMVQAWREEEDPTKRQYASFKIYDRKNDANVETSCAPAFLSNYFQKSDLPWEISPAFFRPDVLIRFKADPERFSMDDRSVGCRNAWHLKTFDINESGQVHTYIGYLAALPYEEQLYWQSFNEWPRGAISERANKTDILGDWDTIYDALNALKEKVRQLDKSQPVWWNPRGDALAEATRYPVTDSPKEWGDEILALDQLIVEGFQLGPLKAIAKAAGCETDPGWQSLRVLQEILNAKGLTVTAAKAIVSPLQILHGLRTTLKGHATGSAKPAAESKARSEHGTLG